MRHVLILLVTLSIGGMQRSAAGAPVLQQLYQAPSGSGNPPLFLIQGAGGYIYGTMGTEVFRITPSGSVSLVTIQSSLNSELTLADDGCIYGTTSKGGSGDGTIFRITPAGQTTTVYSFTTNNPSPVGLRNGVDGSLYGATAGSPEQFFPEPITIFQFATNGTFTTLLTASNGTAFTSSPVQGSDGTLYGTAAFTLGFSSGATIYSLSTSGNYQMLHRITNGTIPDGLVFGPDGALYGPSTVRNPAFGSSGPGSIFRITTNGAFADLFAFNSTNGSNPSARLLSTSDGALYGTTSQGGVSNLGTIFRLTTNGDLTTLVQFTGTNGRSPACPLIEASDGNKYGGTSGSGMPIPGTIFRLVDPPMISGLQFSNGTATLSWNSFTNGIYRVEYKFTPFDPNWTTLIPKVTASDATISISDTAASDPQRLYRVVLLP